MKKNRCTRDSVFLISTLSVFADFLISISHSPQYMSSPFLYRVSLFLKVTEPNWIEVSSNFSAVSSNSLYRLFLFSIRPLQVDRTQQSYDSHWSKVCQLSKRTLCVPFCLFDFLSSSRKVKASQSFRTVILVCARLCVRMSLKARVSHVFNSLCIVAV